MRKLLFCLHSDELAHNFAFFQILKMKHMELLVVMGLQHLVLQNVFTNLISMVILKVADPYNICKIVVCIEDLTRALMYY